MAASLGLADSGGVDGRGHRGASSVQYAMKEGRGDKKQAGTTRAAQTRGRAREEEREGEEGEGDVDGALLRLTLAQGPDADSGGVHGDGLGW